MLVNPGSIDPFLSAHRVFSGNYWFLYLILLICVELHATIGLYRLCMKWGWFTGTDAKTSRKKLKKVKNRLTIFFLTVGFLSLAMFLFIGFQNRSNAGEPYPGTAYQKISHAEEETSVSEPAVESDAAHPAGTSHDAAPAAPEETPAKAEAVTHDSADSHDTADTHEAAAAHDATGGHDTGTDQSTEPMPETAPDAGAHDTTPPATETH
jgi:fumarate reductase subunit C